MHIDPGAKRQFCTGVIFEIVKQLFNQKSAQAVIAKFRFDPEKMHLYFAGPGKEFCLGVVIYHDDHPRNFIGAGLPGAVDCASGSDLLC